MTKRRLPIKLGAGVIILLLNCSFLLSLTSESTLMDFFMQLRQGLFWADNNLFDARTILRFKEKIDLSIEQEKKIENIMLAYEESSFRSSAEIKIGELRFATYIKSEKVDRKEIAKLIKQISTKKTDWIVNYINYLLDLREILSSEQLEKMKVIAKKERIRRHRTASLPDNNQE